MTLFFNSKEIFILLLVVDDGTAVFIRNLNVILPEVDRKTKSPLGVFYSDKILWQLSTLEK